jgi:putative transposase
MSGKPAALYLDNAAEFKSEALRRGCEQHGVQVRWRPPGQPHYGGIVERRVAPGRGPHSRTGQCRRT